MDLAPDQALATVTSRPARVLLAWLDDDTAHRLLGVHSGERSAGDVARLLDDARAARASRGHDVDAGGGVREVPPPLAERAAAAREHDGAAATVRLVDLTRVVAMQPYVFTDRMPGPDCATATLAELFDVTVPATGSVDVAVGFNRAANTFVVASRDQNLQVLGEFSGPVPGAPPGAIGVGFLVAAPPSFVRVAIVEGRAILVDGYHRAVGLLRLGVTVVPAVVEAADSFGAVWTEGMLDEAACLGPQPALVADYFDDAVAASTTLPHVGRSVTVTAVESNLDAPLHD